MTLDSDLLIDRRSLKRRLTFWRVLAIVAIVLAIIFAASRNGRTDIFGLGVDHIARVTISGFISDNRARHELLTKLRKDRHVKAVIVAVDSPGGTTAGGEALYDDLREIAKVKPVAAVFGTAATSAAYLGGIATDHIVARGNTITGSVGVIFQWAEVSDLLSKIGVKVDEIRSGPLKAKPSPFSPSDEDALRLSKELVADSQVWFLNLVQERRKAAAASIDDIKTGRIYTGRQALQIGLIDEIGDETTAIKWFTEARDVKKDLKVLDWRPETQGASSLFSSSIASLAAKMGLGGLIDANILAELEELKERPLDGLFSIWHPGLGKSETVQ
jgi:protease IV